MTVLPSYFQIRDVHRPNLRKHLDTFERFALTTQPTNKIRTAKIIRNVYLSLGYRTPKIIWTKGLLSNHICNALIHKIFKTDLHSDSLRYGRLGWVYYDDARHDPDIANSTLGQITENISDCLVSIRYSYIFGRDLSGNETEQEAEQNRIRHINKIYKTDHMMKNIMHGSREIIWDHIREYMAQPDSGYNRLEGAIDQFWDEDQIYPILRSLLSNYIEGETYGQYAALQHALDCHFIETNIGGRNHELMHNLTKLCQFAGPILFRENFCFVSERQSLLRLDDAGRLHCEDGPAHAYPDGYEAYAWHGVSYPKAWTAKKPSASEALQLKNIELRRVACEMVGWEHILGQLDSYILDKDPDPEIGELVSVNIPDIGRERFLRVTCGTGRIFALPVPPSMTSARAANAWTWGLEPDQYKPEIRT